MNQNPYKTFNQAFNDELNVWKSKEEIVNDNPKKCARKSK